MENQTLEYYDKNAGDFFEGTVNIDMSSLYKRFEAYLKPNAHILDLDMLFSGIGDAVVKEWWISGDVRVERKNERWLNVVVGKRVDQMKFNLLE